MSLGGLVDDDRQDEDMIIGHVERALDREAPFSAEITLVARFGVRRDDGHEEIAFANLPPDLLIPGIPADQVALVVPHLEPVTGQGLSQRLCRAPVFRGVAQENCRAQALRRTRVGNGHG